MDAGLLELSFLSSESDSESDPELEELYESFLTLEDSISADTQAAFSCTVNQPEELGEEEEKKQMLYEGAAVTTFQTILLVYQFVLRHSFSTKTFTEFLQLLAVLLPKAADLPKSVYLFKKLASLFPEAQSRKHYYCTTCQMPVEKDGVCDCGQTNISQFITVPLQPQLKRLMEDPSSWNLLQQRFTRFVSDDVQDIYDGKGYKRHQHFLNHPAHVSLSLNTDGVSLFRSSKAEIWPVWIVVNELPKNKRFLRKHMILAALWYAVEDPCVNTYLRPIIDEVNDLYLKGFPVSTPDGDKTARALLLLCSMDLPARARVMNMKKFNGYCGCLLENIEH